MTDIKDEGFTIRTNVSADKKTRELAQQAADSLSVLTGRKVPVTHDIPDTRACGPYDEDEPFMAWLEKAVPDWSVTFSGTLQTMYEAWLAGREYEGDQRDLSEM